MICLSFVKLVEGHDPRYALGATLFYAMAVFELGVGLALLFDLRADWCAGLAAAFFAGSIGWALLAPVAEPCGCFGSMRLAPGMRVAIAATCGFLACCHLLGVLAHSTEARADAGRR